MECEGVGQEKETDETKHRTPITQQNVQLDGNQYDVEERGSEEDSVEAKVRIAVVGPPAAVDAEGSTAAQPTRHKRSKK